jgi:hypothetical protein
MDCVFQASGIIPLTRIAYSKPPGLFRALGLRIPCLRDYSAHLDCVFQASGIIPRTWIAFSKPPELSRALGLRFPSPRNYPAHLDCVLLVASLDSTRRSLKYELVYHHRFATRAQARTAIFDYTSAIVRLSPILPLGTPDCSVDT